MSNNAQHTEALMLQHTEENTMTKSPYEIRLDLVGMAIGILTQKAESANMQEMSNAERKGREVNLAPAPTAEEVIAEAEKLNEFVSHG